MRVRNYSQGNQVLLLPSITVSSCNVAHERCGRLRGSKLQWRYVLCHVQYALINDARGSSFVTSVFIALHALHSAVEGHFALQN